MKTDGGIEEYFPFISSLRVPSGGGGVWEAAEIVGSILIPVFDSFSMEGASRILMLCLVLATTGLAARVPQNINVLQYGASGNGKTDDTKAFLKAWTAACTQTSASTLLVPASRTFLLSQITFKGPCKNSINFQVLGNIVAPSKLWSNDPDNGNWITIVYVDDLTITGSGMIDGKGAVWWDCKAKGRCSILPTGLAVLICNNFKLGGLKFINSPGKHVTVFGSVGVLIGGLTITAPGNSPNTDGLLIQESQHVRVVGCTIGTGDDCIAIGTGSIDVNITNVSCGPGHGISIGSLGIDGAKGMVEQIHVSNCFFYETMNGVRIKTAQGGSGIVKGISFENINLTSVQYPIVIDQYYCPNRNCPNRTSAVQVTDVRFSRVHGTGNNQYPAITLACSQSVACTGIVMDHVNIESSIPKQRPTSYCLNAHGQAKPPVLPAVPCLS